MSELTYTGHSMRAPVIRSNGTQYSAQPRHGNAGARDVSQEPARNRANHKAPEQRGIYIAETEVQQPVTPVSTTACTMSVPTITFGGNCRTKVTAS